MFKRIFWKDAHFSQTNLIWQFSRRRALLRKRKFCKTRRWRALWHKCWNVPLICFLRVTQLILKNCLIPLSIRMECFWNICLGFFWRPLQTISKSISPARKRLMIGIGFDLYFCRSHPPLQTCRKHYVSNMYILSVYF